jgi:hypothetical protein
MTLWPPTHLCLPPAQPDQLGALRPVGMSALREGPTGLLRADAAILAAVITTLNFWLENEIALDATHAKTSKSMQPQLRELLGVLAALKSLC